MAGTESELAVTVTRDGAPVTDLDPYLGALGHLVAIRNGDLAYLHVHPIRGRRRRRADGPVRRRGPDRRDLRAVLRLLPRFRADGASSPRRAMRRSSDGDDAGEHDDGTVIDVSDTAQPTRSTWSIERHDVRVVRGAHRAAPQQARRRHGDGQLRHRAGQGACARSGVDVDDLDRPGRRRPATRPATPGRRSRRRATATDRRREPAAARPADRVGTAVAAGRGAGDGPGAAVRLLAVAVADPRRARRHVGGLAVPPGRLGQPAPRRGDDGHAHLDRRARRLRVVAVRAVPRRRRRARHDARVLAAPPTGRWARA